MRAISGPSFIKGPSWASYTILIAGLVAYNMHSHSKLPALPAGAGETGFAHTASAPQKPVAPCKPSAGTCPRFASEGH
jgi:hypothetical protein